MVSEIGLQAIRKLADHCRDGAMQQREEISEIHQTNGNGSYETRPLQTISLLSQTEEE